MKKIIISLVLLLIIPSSSFAISFYVETEDEIDYYQYLLDSGAVTNKYLDLDEHMPRSEFWKVSMKLAGFFPERNKKMYITPIKGIDDDKWYSRYAREAYKLGLFEGRDEIDPAGSIRKMETLSYTFKLFGIPTPFFNDLIMDYADVPNDHPVVSKCLSLDICDGETDRIFGANKPLKRSEVYRILVKSYLEAYGENEMDLDTGIGSMDILEEMINILETEYYKPEDIDRQQLLYSAMEGLAEGVGDKYSVFMKPLSSNSYNESLDGEFEGIGAYVEKDDLGIRITTPVNGGPAKQAGLRANDIIIEADGHSLKDISLEEGITIIKGPKGSTVKLKVMRGSSSFDIDIVRDRINIPAVESHIKGSTLVVRMNQFNKNSDEKFEEVLTKNPGVDSLIIDLRSNPGGYLDTAENMLSMLVDEGEIILQIKYPDFEETSASDSRKKFKFRKMVVLVDDASASASEILAGTLQDYGIADVVGIQSFGKGTVQTITQFFDGSQFKYTIAEWLTAKGNSIQGVGIKPDYTVEDDPDGFGDEIMDKAMLLVR